MYKLSRAALENHDTFSTLYGYNLPTIYNVRLIQITNAILSLWKTHNSWSGIIIIKNKTLSIITTKQQQKAFSKAAKKLRRKWEREIEKWILLCKLGWISFRTLLRNRARKNLVGTESRLNMSMERNMFSLGNSTESIFAWEKTAL